MGSNPKKVNDGDKKGIRPQFAPELQQSFPVNQGANSRTRCAENTGSTNKRKTYSPDWGSRWDMTRMLRELKQAEVQEICSKMEASEIKLNKLASPQHSAWYKRSTTSTETP